jgi:hypothetical protein
MNDDDLINQVYRKIEREKVIINAANAMRQSSNPQVQQSLDSQVREAQKGIDYLEERMRELQMRKTGHGANPQAMGQPSGNEGLRPSSYEGMSPHQRALFNSQKGGPPALPSKGSRGGYRGDAGDYGDPGPGGYMGQDTLSGGHGMMPPRAPFPSGPGSAIPRARKDYTKLGQSPVLLKTKIAAVLRVNRSDKG